MTCTEFRERVDRYARNQLDPRESAAFETHLSDCAACSAWLEVQEPAWTEVSQLPRSIEPAADIWPQVREEIGRRKVRPLPRVTVPVWLLATAAVLLVAASVGTTGYLLSRRATEPPSRQAAEHRRAAELESQYASATAELGAELDKAKSRLSPETLATIERNLRVIDSALAESRRALAGDPGNPVLEQLVVAVWRQKMDFLRRVTALAPAA
jgi:anti-sigma factor RsiW